MFSGWEACRGTQECRREKHLLSLTCISLNAAPELLHPRSEGGQQGETEDDPLHTDTEGVPENVLREQDLDFSLVRRNLDAARMAGSVLF